MAVIVVKGVSDEASKIELEAEVKSVVAASEELDPDRISVFLVPGSSEEVCINVCGLGKCSSTNEESELANPCQRIKDALKTVVEKYLQTGQSIMVQGYSMGQSAMIA